MALSSTSSTSSYPDLSSSLNSFLSALQCSLGSSPSSPLIAQNSPMLSSQQGPEHHPHLLREQSADKSHCSEPLFEYAYTLDAPNNLNQWQQAQHARQQLDEDTPMTSFSALEWEAEQLGLLLGITGQDVTVPGLERSSTNTDLNMNTKSQHQRGDNANLNSREHSLPPFSVAEIKQPDVKEDFVHPGFYSLSSQSQSNSSIPSLVPLRMARKRSLQEEGSPILSCDVPGATNSVKRAGNRQSPQPYAAELRRYSLDGHLSTMAPVTTPPHSWAYSTPPKSPSTPSSLQGQINSTIESQQHSDAPPGQPYMTAFSSLGWTFGQKGLSPSLRHAHFTGFQRSSVAKPGSSSIPQSRKKRASKFKTDLLFPSVLGELQYPLNAVPPPLQQQHHQPYLLPQYAISTQQSLLQKQHSLLQRYRPTLLSQKGQRAHSRTSSYRRNPGEVPASTLPPDHFVFQEALLGIGCSGQASGVRSQSIPQTDTNPNVRESTRNEMQTLARSLSEPDGTHCLSLPVAMGSSTVSAKHQEKMPSSPLHSLPSSPILRLSDNHCINPSISLPLDAMHLSITESLTKVDTLNKSHEDQASGNHPLSAAAAFAQSLSTVTTLDPAATKLIDQLRLQEYLRSVEPTSTPSPPTTLATSIIACNSAIDCSSPSSSPVIHSL